MPLTTNGRNYLADKFCGGSAYQVLDSSHTYLCVGDGTTTFSVADTDLQGTNKTRKIVDGGYPSTAANVNTLRSTFGALEGNHDWKEWGVANASSGNYLLQRKVENLGTKVSGAVWEFTVTDTWT